MRFFHIIWLIALVTANLNGQDVPLEAYFYETGNRGYLNQVKYSIKDLTSNQVVAKGFSDKEGSIQDTLYKNKSYLLEGKKSGFYAFKLPFDTKNLKSDKNLFLSLEMKRKPGYIFEATLAPKRMNDEPVEALTNARIEIYNNTTEKEELSIPKLAGYTFSHALEPGNHYTMLIRKKGYYNKRIEAYVDVQGCILCFEGTGEIKPGVVDNLTEGLRSGTLLSNLEMQPIQIGKAIEIEDIYYDYNQSHIRKDARPILDNLIKLLKNNPALIVEMGSHTDARGRDEYNKKLSQKRAKAVVEYLKTNGNISPNRLSAYGYGESQLRNKCQNNVPCSEAQHQENRRTEMKVTGVLDFDPYEQLSLAEIIRKEKGEEELERIIQGKSEQVRVSSFEDLPEEIKQDILKQKREKEGTDNKPTNTEPKTSSSAAQKNTKEEQIADPIRTVESISQTNNQPRIIEFDESHKGYTILLPKIDESQEFTEKILLQNHGRVYRTKLGQYALGLFDEKIQAKQYSKSLESIYDGLEILYVNKGRLDR